VCRGVAVATGVAVAVAVAEPDVRRISERILHGGLARSGDPHREPVAGCSDQ
jgi:hypothetical protein